MEREKHQLFIENEKRKLIKQTNNINLYLVTEVDDERIAQFRTQTRLVVERFDYQSIIVIINLRFHKIIINQPCSGIKCS